MHSARRFSKRNVDANVAPIPPHLSLEQTKNFLSSILKDDAQALGFVKQVAKDVLAGSRKRYRDQGAMAPYRSV